MSIRGIGDAYAFQRLLWLLIGTIIVPTVLLSAFGVAAIRFQAAAFEDRLRAARQEVASRAAAWLEAELRQTDRDTRTAALACAPTSRAPCPPLPGVRAIWRWTDDESPPLAVALGTLEPGADTMWTEFEGAPLGVFASEGGTTAYVLDVSWLDDHLDDAFDQGDTHFGLRRDTQSESTFDVASLGPWREEPDAYPLGGPLVGWRLHVDDPSEREARESTTLVYSLVLAGLVVSVLAGGFVTLNAAAREIRLSRLQTDFVSTVSHELRTPLTSIRMFVDTLRSGRLTDPARTRECLDLMAEETDRLSRRIERVLDWARMEGGRRIYEMDLISVRDVADAAIAAFRSQTLLDAGTDLSVDIPDGLPRIEADGDAIVEAILNLLQNAHKYTAPPRRLTLRAHARGGHVGLSVRDNGPGIPRHERGRVWEKFYQIDSRLTRTQQGSGLGLAIVRAIATAHDGRVELTSEVGRGSEFTVWLPAARSAR